MTDSYLNAGLQTKIENAREYRFIGGPFHQQIRLIGDRTLTRTFEPNAYRKHGPNIMLYCPSKVEARLVATLHGEFEPNDPAVLSNIQLHGGFEAEGTAVPWQGKTKVYIYTAGLTPSLLQEDLLIQVPAVRFRQYEDVCKIIS